MMDGSLMEDGKTPSSYEYNVKVTAEVVRLAHARGVSVEGELGCLGSLESGEGEQGMATGRPHADPRSAADRSDQAAEFVEATGVDAGGSHRHQPWAPTSSPASRTARYWR